MVSNVHINMAKEGNSQDETGFHLIKAAVDFVVAVVVAVLVVVVAAAESWRLPGGA